jgi:hypothetical protein
LSVSALLDAVLSAHHDVVDRNELSIQQFGNLQWRYHRVIR